MNPLQIRIRGHKSYKTFKFLHMIPTSYISYTNWVAALTLQNKWPLLPYSPFLAATFNNYDYVFPIPV